jgi:hypothetical protein
VYRFRCSRVAFIELNRDEIDAVIVAFIELNRDEIDAVIVFCKQIRVHVGSKVLELAVPLTTLIGQVHIATKPTGAMDI